MSNTKLTKEQLELMGIFSIESKIYPKRHFVPCLGEVDLYESTDVKDIFEMLWKAGNEFGQKQGMKMKVQELKKVLEIED
jgi:hypothetical protein